MRADLHIHSHYSKDGGMSAEEILDAARKAGLQAVAVTDHNDFRGSQEALSLKPQDLLIIPGAEYSTDQGHFLVYFLQSALEKDKLKRDGLGRFFWQDVVTAAHEQDALVFWAHPFKKRAICFPFVTESVDGIEIYNSRAAFSSSRAANPKAYETAVLHRKAFSAGSDAHWRGEIGHAFWEWEPSSEELKGDYPAAVKSALRSGKGRVWGSPSCRLYEPASQIRKNLATDYWLGAAKQTVKFGLTLFPEFLRYTGLRGKMPGIWLDLQSSTTHVQMKSEENT